MEQGWFGSKWRKMKGMNLRNIMKKNPAITLGVKGKQRDGKDEEMFLATWLLTPLTKMRIQKWENGWENTQRSVWDMLLMRNTVHTEGNCPDGESPGPLVTYWKIINLHTYLRPHSGKRRHKREPWSPWFSPPHPLLIFISDLLVPPLSHWRPCKLAHISPPPKFLLLPSHCPQDKLVIMC